MQIVISNSKGGSGKSTLAICLADVLNGDLIDFDNQGTLTHAAKFTKRHAPLQDASKATKKHIIYDTPPYNAAQFLGVFESCDLILMPTKVSVPDLLATTAIINLLTKKKLLDKATLVFNEVRKPHNKTYKEVMQLFNQNYTIKKANTELSNLIAYRRVFTEALPGKARNEVLQLTKELGINTL